MRSGLSRSWRTRPPATFGTWILRWSDARGSSRCSSACSTALSPSAQPTCSPCSDRLASVSRELIREFVSGHATSARFLRGRCLSYGEGITFFPLVEIVQEAAGVERTDDVATGWSKLAALAEGVEDRDPIVALVAGLLSWAEPVTAEEAYWALRKLFEHLARQGPLVVVFDDIHWAEPAFLDLIEYLADWTRDAPLLLVCVARPELLELRTGWAGGKLNATTILLEALPGDEVSRLVDNLLVKPTSRLPLAPGSSTRPRVIRCLWRRY